MTTREDLDRRLSEWLGEEGPQRSPQRLVHTTRERISETSQAGSIRALRLRLPSLGDRRRIVLVGTVAASAVLATWFTIGGSLPGSGGTTSPYTTTKFLPPLRLALPTTWDVDRDARGELDLRAPGGGTYTYPDGITFHDGISIFRRPVAESNVKAAAVPGIGNTALALATWLDGHAGLVASGLTQVTVGGAPAYRILIALPAPSAAVPDHCTSDHPGVTACSSLFISDDRLGQYGFGIVGPETALVYLIDAPSGDTVMVVIDDVDGVDRDALIAAATPIIESLEFVK